VVQTCLALDVGNEATVRLGEGENLQTPAAPLKTVASGLDQGRPVKATINITVALSRDIGLPVELAGSANGQYGPFTHRASPPVSGVRFRHRDQAMRRGGEDCLPYRPRTS
jgi:hypothetical protein